MIKIIYKKKWFKIIIVTLLISAVFIYRTISRRVLKVDYPIITQIEVCRPLQVGTFSEEQVQEVNSNLENFAAIIYTIPTKNDSDNIYISNISIDPVFSNEMKKHVYWDSANDMPNDVTASLSPHREKHYGRRIIIRRNGLNDDELLNIAEKNSFKISYDTSKGIPISGYWHSSINVKVQEIE